MQVYDFKDYRAFIRDRLERLPKKGHGQFKKMAEHLGIQTSMLSQIMAGHREMNSESASLLCEFFGLNDMESDMFLCLVQLARAGNTRLKAQLERQLRTLRTQSEKIEKRISKEKELDEATKAIFYSQWYYSGVRLVTALDGCDTVDAISTRLRLPRAQVARVVEFLVNHGLCVSQNGKLSYGPQSTHVSADSPLAARHHANWRYKAIENFEGLKPWELVFTSPVAVSQKDATLIRRQLLDVVDQWAKIADQSSSERLMCLNLDWIEVE
jgi:uncharacterized protein (TIGR02147 family)